MMNETEYLPKIHGNRTPNYIIAAVIEDYCNNMDQSFYTIGQKHNVSVSTVSDFIELVLLNRPIRGRTVTIKSAV